MRRISLNAVKYTRAFGSCGPLSACIRAGRPVSLPHAPLLTHPASRAFSIELSFPEPAFHAIADETLEEMLDSLGAVEAELEDVELNLSQGVLTLILNEDHGSKAWVINKQTPNRQIWWSSPISGPRRYEYTPSEVLRRKAEQWTYSRDSTQDLHGSLKKEIETVTGIRLK